MNFGQALEALKLGQRVARAGWNGKGMFLFLVKGRFDGPARGFRAGEQVRPGHPSLQDGISSSLFMPYETDADRLRLPCIAMRTATGSDLHGWLASQTDMLAEDWVLV